MAADVIWAHEAMIRAINAATAAELCRGDENVRRSALARESLAWSALAALLPVRGATATETLRPCGHHVGVLPPDMPGGTWLHAINMSACDRPPGS